MVITYRHLIALLWLFILVQGLSSRIRADAIELVPQVSVDFTVYARRHIDGIRYGQYNPEGQLTGSLPLQFRAGGRSEIYAYHGPARMQFFTESLSEDSEGNQLIQRSLVGELYIPQGATRLLIVFLQQEVDEPAGLPWHLIAIDDSVKSLPWGHLKVFNLTQAQYQGSFITGEATVRPEDLLAVEPGENQAMPFTPAGQVQLAYRFQDAFWQFVYQDNFECEPDERLLLLLSSPASLGGRQLRGALLRDYREETNSLNTDNPTLPEGQSPTQE